MRGARSPEERFWDKVTKGAPGDCWSWTASTTVFGYGKLLVDGRLLGAHRFSYELHNGKIGAGLWVLHRCDNPACVNPEHLFLGTPAQNVSDMDQKGRRKNRVSAGESNPSARLRVADVIEIRSALAKGEMARDLADKFSVSIALIRHIKCGRAWASVA